MTIDILLVNPIFLSENEAERELMSPYFPLGLLYLGAFLRERGFSPEIFDGTFTTGIEDFTATLDRYDPKMVGITALQPNREIALTLAGIAHERGATIIMGGPDPTFSPETYLSNPAVDIVVHHEGELTLVELLEANQVNGLINHDLPNIPGIAYKDIDGDIAINPRRPYILNLDELPLPARDLIDIEKYLEIWREQNGYASLSISVARGCPYGCEWCQDAVHGQELRLRSPESVAAEVKILKQSFNIDRLRVVDDVDGIEREWIEAWNEVAVSEDAIVPFEALYEVQRKDVPMLDIRDSL
jgi:radical SAM superfamily enzyme YgiQ (UPF0313 family)